MPCAKNIELSLEISKKSLIEIIRNGHEKPTRHLELNSFQSKVEVRIMRICELLNKLLSIEGFHSNNPVVQEYLHLIVEAGFFLSKKTSQPSASFPSESKSVGTNDESMIKVCTTLIDDQVDTPNKVDGIVSSDEADSAIAATISSEFGEQYVDDERQQSLVVQVPPDSDLHAISVNPEDTYDRIPFTTFSKSIRSNEGIKIACLSSAERSVNPVSPSHSSITKTFVDPQLYSSEDSLDVSSVWSNPVIFSELFGDSAAPSISYLTFYFSPMMSLSIPMPMPSPPPPPWQKQMFEVTLEGRPP